jgi:hypothetical protein
MKVQARPRWARDALVAMAVSRMVIGTAALLRPQLLRLVTGGRPLGPRAQALTRIVGVRDLTLGAGVLLAPRDALALVAGLGAASDAGDAFASLVAASRFDDDRRGRWLLQAGVAAMAASTSAVALAAVSRRR